LWTIHHQETWPDYDPLHYTQVLNTGQLVIFTSSEANTDGEALLYNLSDGSEAGSVPGNGVRGSNQTQIYCLEIDQNMEPFTTVFSPDLSSQWSAKFGLEFYGQTFIHLNYQGNFRKVDINE
jgi:hypothetical protein